MLGGVLKETTAGFAATWCEEETGQVVGSTFSGTVCWAPRKPWAIKFSGDGFEGVIRCGECQGCLEFDRRRLADRLHRKYTKPKSGPNAQGQMSRKAEELIGRSAGPHLFVVRIWTKLLDQSALSHRLHRRRGIELEPGFFRLGDQSFALLSRGQTRINQVLKSLRLKYRIERVRLSRRRRAWRVVTAGVNIAREVYGEQVKRWYVRGLPPAEKKSWEVERHAMQKPWTRASGARARTANKLILVPPSVWRLRSSDRRVLRREFAAARSPEGIERVMGLVAHALAGRSRQSNLIEPPAGRLTREQVQAWYARMAQQKRVASASEPLPNPISLPSEGGGYVSSGHTSGNDPPGEDPGAALDRGEAWIRARKKRLLDEQIARFLEAGRRGAKS